MKTSLVVGIVVAFLVAVGVSQAIYVQLELNDLAGIGSNPLSLLTRSVPGYGKINASSADRVFGVD